MTPEQREQWIETAARAMADHDRAADPGIMLDKGSYFALACVVLDAVLPLHEAAIRAEYEQVGIRARYLLEDMGSEDGWTFTMGALLSHLDGVEQEAEPVYRRVRQP